MSAAGNASPAALRVRVWTMATLGLTEAAVAPWAAGLDAGERARAARFAMPRSRIAFIAAHALARAALGAAVGVAPTAFGFAAGAHGKPQARLDGRCADVAFNLSHTDGMVGVAVAMAPGLALGFDLEPLARCVPLAVARRYFTASEVAWLDGLPVPARTEGFLRLWTLKEAFIKATGKGLTQDLSSFWFSVDPAVVSFAPDLGEAAREWSFAQRILERDDRRRNRLRSESRDQTKSGSGMASPTRSHPSPGAGFVAAIACRGGVAGIEAVWREIDAAGFDPAAGLPGGAW